ncbi:MAG: Ig-like domain-containing protein, partial [Chloroflexi bacterium]|nr:Ig-like domain-containing protein [Chloroflexota bacterium]
MKNSINQRIITALLSIAISILILCPVLSIGTIPVAGAASTPITITINNIQDYVNTLETITGTTSDTTPGTISKVQVQITNQSNNTYWDGSTWKAQLNIQTVDSAGIVGEYTSLAFNSSGNPAISYFDNTNKDLKSTRCNGSTWVLQTVDSTGNTGYYTSLAFDNSGNPAISYLDLTNGNLKFAGWNGSSWVLQTVDSAGNVGWNTSLAFDGSGNPTISYYDYTNTNLKFAGWNGSSWVLQTVDSAGDVGQYTSLAYDSNGNPAISYWDNTNDNLKFAGLNGSWNDATGKATWSYNMPSLTDGSFYKITARVIDNSGNLLANAVEYFTCDNTVPTVTLSSTSTSPTRIAPIPMTVTFSEAVTGFVVSDITVINGTAGNFVAISAAIYTFDVTPTAQGVVTVNVAAGVAHDAVFNNNIAAIQFSITYDTTVPPANQDQS